MALGYMKSIIIITQWRIRTIQVRYLLMALGMLMNSLWFIRIITEALRGLLSLNLVIIDLNIQRFLRAYRRIRILSFIILALKVLNCPIYFEIIRRRILCLLIIQYLLIHFSELMINL